MIASTIGISATNVKTAPEAIALHEFVAKKTKMSNASVTNYTVVITGATGGIGFHVFTIV